MSKEKLKPCPFCGGEAGRLSEEDFSVACQNDNCFFSFIWQRPGDWNERAGITELESELAALIDQKPPCSSGCYHHQTHPCEKCGRISGFLPRPLYRWIPVSERLPKHNKSVWLIWRPFDFLERPDHIEGIVGNFCFRDKNNKPISVPTRVWANGMYYDIKTHITHWREQILPPLPEKGTSDES